jgi:hypothetical protein
LFDYTQVEATKSNPIPAGYGDSYPAPQPDFRKSNLVQLNTKELHISASFLDNILTNPIMHLCSFNAPIHPTNPSKKSTTPTASKMQAGSTANSLPAISWL